MQNRPRFDIEDLVNIDMSEEYGVLRTMVWKIAGVHIRLRWDKRVVITYDVTNDLGGYMTGIKEENIRQGIEE